MAKKNTALAERPANTALDIAGDRKSARGREGIRQQDMTLPRLAIAQKTSPQLDDGKPEYVEDLKLYDLFNSLTGESFGRGPVKVALVRYTQKAIQFDEENNVVDPRVPLDDPRCRFGPAGEKPVATIFHEYLAVLADTFEPIVVSMKGTQIKAAKNLNGLITVRGGDLWGGLYDVSSKSQQSGAYTVGGFVVKPAGRTSEELATFCEELYESTKGQEIKTDIDTTPEAESEKAPF
jgi:hypothetical protein